MHCGTSFIAAGPLACALVAWRAHHREIKAYLVHRLSDPATADDLLQDVFLSTVRQGQAFCRIDNQRAWLFEVARNAVTDQLRAAKPHVELPEDLTQEAVQPEPVDALADCMEHVLGELAETDADVIRRCDLQGMKLQAYADARGLTLPGVKSRIQRARRRMRNMMVRNCQVQLDEAGRVCCHVPRADQ